MLTLGRIVSLRDYEDFARAFAGVAKALATWTWDGERQGVFVTIAGVDGAPVAEASETYKNLVAAMHDAGDPYVPLRVKSYAAAKFKLAAVVTRDPDYLADKVEADVRAALLSYFAFDARAFGQPVALSEVMAAMQSVPGVVAVDVNALHRLDLVGGGGVQPRLPARVPQPGTGGTPSPAELLTSGGRRHRLGGGMMNAETLYNLLPAIYRVRDAEQGGPLQALMGVLAEQVTALEENLAQLYDDQFIETAADWVVPYIGDLIGYRALYGVTPELTSPRAEVANTIAYRRRKGTAAMLEQLARDVTGWDARVVEFFERLATTQYMNHIRPDNLHAPDLRRWEPLERIGTAFDTVAHTADVRHINRRRGKYNIPNVGIFLWRLAACPLTRSPALAVDATRYTFSPLGNAAPLFTDPVTEDAITHLAEPLNVPLPISRRVLHEQLGTLLRPGQKLLH